MTCAFAPPNPNEFTPATRSSVPSRKRLELSRHAQFQFFKIDMRIRFRKMKTGRNLTVLEYQHRFEQTGDAGGCFQMAKIRFDGTNRERRSIGCRIELPPEHVLRSDLRPRCRPCASTNPISSGAIPASWHASLTKRVCASGLGNVIPLVCPSWLIDVPRLRPGSGRRPRSHAKSA